MNKKLLLVLLLVVVLCLSLAVVGCKSADTPQDETPQDGGEVIDDPAGGNAVNLGKTPWYPVGEDIDLYPYAYENELDPTYDPIETWHPYEYYNQHPCTTVSKVQGPWYAYPEQDPSTYGQMVYYCVTPDDKYYINTHDSRLDVVDVTGNLVRVLLKRNISLESLWNLNSPYNDPMSMDWGIEFEGVEWATSAEIDRQWLAKYGQKAKMFADYHRSFTLILPQDNRQAVFDAIELLQMRDDVFKVIFRTPYDVAILDSESYEGDPANEGTIEYYDNLVGVQLTHDASLNSLSLPSLLDMDWGADVIEVTAPYHERDDDVATQVQQGLTDSESVKGYKRSLWLTLSYHDLTKLFEFVTVLKQRDDVEQAYAMPKVQYVAYDEDDGGRGAHRA